MEAIILASGIGKKIRCIRKKKTKMPLKFKEQYKNN